MSKTPAKAWQEMVRGNERFVTGNPLHPRQDVDRREELANSQAPSAALFGCSDSRLAAEIIFDKGLGDLFVVRNAGQVVSASVIASLEYAVAVLRVPLIVVLAHDSCGAVQAAIDLQSADAAPLPVHIAKHIEPIAPAVHAATHDGADADARDVGRLHLRNTVRGLVEASELISDAIAEGRLAVVGANYRLSEGRAAPDVVIGAV
jgi:carbonic anhydrase